MPVTRTDQILATFSMTGGTGAYTGAFTAVTGFRAPSAIGNGATGKFTVKACNSSSDLTPTGTWEEFEGVYSTSGSGSITRTRLIASSTGSFINWTNPTACFIEGSYYAEDITTGGGGAFGDGSDGSVTFDGSSTVLGLVPSSNTYTLTRDIYCTDITIDSGVTIVPNGYGIYATGTLTNNGAIRANGTDGTDGTNGAAGAAGTGAQPNRNTIWGAAATAGAGAAGRRITTASGQDGIAGTSPGGTNLGGSGGVGGDATSPAGSNGGNGGSAGPATYLPRMCPAAVVGVKASTSWTCNGGGGGSGAARQSAANVCSSGGSGGPGGWVLISARTLVNNGTISANGGNGGNGYVSGAGNQFAGGGGGGGGGGIIVVYGTLSGSGTITASGGAAGTNATFGTGAGTAAANGADGTVILLPA